MMTTCCGGELRAIRIKIDEVSHTAAIRGIGQYVLAWISLDPLMPARTVEFLADETVALIRLSVGDLSGDFKPALDRVLRRIEDIIPALVDDEVYLETGCCQWSEERMAQASPGGSLGHVTWKNGVGVNAENLRDEEIRDAYRLVHFHGLIQPEERPIQLVGRCFSAEHGERQYLLMQQGVTVHFSLWDANASPSFEFEADAGAPPWWRRFFSLGSCMGGSESEILIDEQDFWTCGGAKFTINPMSPPGPGFPAPDASCARRTRVLGAIRAVFKTKDVPGARLQNLLPQCHLDDLWHGREVSTMPTLTMEDLKRPAGVFAFASVGNVSIDASGCLRHAE
eukprot:GEMP01046368.1.p1 GENE.GEMP01046368.1~~GEMP01046368.1.p1  ORF type:complete len:339 (+),score=81.32 GEMP01046368.1:153-1169(+)